MEVWRIEALKTAAFMQGLQLELREQLKLIADCDVKVRVGSLNEEAKAHVCTATVLVDGDADIEVISELHSRAAMVFAAVLPSEIQWNILVLA